jgi:hypothetical protein
MGRASSAKRRRQRTERAGAASGTGPRDALKLSAALVELIAPYREDGLTRESYEALVGAAATAWNVSLLPDGQHDEAIAEGIAKAEAEDPELLAQILSAMLRRKRERFPDDARVIVHWELAESDDEYRIIVASAA